MGKLVPAYLTLYNTMLCVGWVYALWKTLEACTKRATDRSVYEAAAPVVRACQGAAVMEILHAGSGIVRGSPLAAFLQWFGRSNVLFGILGFIPEVGWPISALFAAWAMSEVFRYPWYAVSQIGTPPRFMTWLRYTVFLPLYPVGVTSEVAIIYSSLPLIKLRKPHSVELPNWLNFAFSYYWFNLFGLFILYPVAFPWLYNTLLQQRRKRLGVQRPKGQ